MATLVLSSVLLLAASASAPPDAYLAARAQLVASADALRFDAAAVGAGLSHKEQLVNASLMALKQAARNASTFLPALPFHSAKAAIGATALFAKLAVLPKGGVLHLHWDSALSTAWAINATYQEGGSDDGDGNGDVAGNDDVAGTELEPEPEQQQHHHHQLAAAGPVHIKLRKTKAGFGITLDRLGTVIAFHSETEVGELPYTLLFARRMGADLLGFWVSDGRQ